MIDVNSPYDVQDICKNIEFNDLQKLVKYILSHKVNSFLHDYPNQTKEDILYDLSFDISSKIKTSN